MGPSYDYEGAIVVVEQSPAMLVLVHPGARSTAEPASLPAKLCGPGELPADEAVHVVREVTGLDVELVRELTTFIQEGTPSGTMNAHGFLARVVGGSMLAIGPEGAVGIHPVDDLPEIVPARVAVRKVLATYLDDAYA